MGGVVMGDQCREVMVTLTTANSYDVLATQYRAYLSCRDELSFGRVTRRARHVREVHRPLH